jgi:hypothetical protein
MGVRIRSKQDATVVWDHSPGLALSSEIRKTAASAPSAQFSGTIVPDGGNYGDDNHGVWRNYIGLHLYRYGPNKGAT